MRAAIYARVSSATQREAHTIDNQLRTLPAFVQAQGWTLAGTYIDDGRSAKTGQLEKREGFTRLLVDAERKLFDVLVVVDIDRLTRTGDMIERASILGPFQRLGISIVTPSGGTFDLRSMLGELYVGLQAQFAAEENRKRVERIMAGKSRAISEGRKPAGHTPFGLTYSRATGKWGLHPVNAPIVREIFERVTGGESCAQVSDDLYARGVVPPRSQWTRHLVWQLATSKFPMGQWVADKKKKLVIPVPAIVDQTTWQRAQDLLTRIQRRGLRHTKHFYLLESLGICGICGHRIQVDSPMKQRKNKALMTAARYVCKARRMQIPGIGRCPSPKPRVDDIDERVWSLISQTLTSPMLLDRVRSRAAGQVANSKNWIADVEKYERRLAYAEKASAQIAARFRRGLLSETAFDIELAAAAKERTFVEGQLEAARAASELGDESIAPDDWIAQLRMLAEHGTNEARRRVVEKFVEKGGVVFLDGDVELTLVIDVGRSGSGSGGAGTDSVVGDLTSEEHGISHPTKLRFRLVA